jgi:hypothetical protein
MKLDSFGVQSLIYERTGEEVEALSPLLKRFNSESIKVETRKGNSYFLKFYRTPEGDLRNRLETEFGSLTFLWNRGMRNIPEPILKDESLKVALFRYIDGELMKPEEITAGDVEKAADFFWSLQHFRKDRETSSFKNASEACFSIADYVRLIDDRLERLSQTGGQELGTFLDSSLLKMWDKIKSGLKSGKPDLTSVLPFDRRILSPSDVGFHNILKEKKDGRLVFVDFEYFGFDDPAKTMCDFVLEPAVPLAEELKPVWLSRFSKLFGLGKEDLERFALIYPILSIKWCCIVLNAFLPNRRHLFGDKLDMVLKTQLEKCRQLHERLLDELNQRSFERWLN